MPSKKQKLAKKKRSGLFWFTVIALPTIVLVGGFLLFNAYINQQAAQKEKAADDVTFAKIEGYVDLIKLQLDREIPEGKWYIDRRCNAPGTKGDFDVYSCKYSVHSETDLDIKERFDETMRPFFHQIPVNLDSNLDQGYSKPSSDSACYLKYSRDKINISGVTCVGSSHDLRYPLSQFSI